MIVVPPGPPYLCNDPGHPALFEMIDGQKGLYHDTLTRVSGLLTSGHEVNDVTRTMPPGILSSLSAPPVGYESGPRIQSMRRRIAAEWGPVFNQIENLAHFRWMVVAGLAARGGLDAVRPLINRLSC